MDWGQDIKHFFKIGRDNSAKPTEHRHAGQSRKTIAEMTEEEREEAFRREIIAPVISHTDLDDQLDNEEKQLMFFPMAFLYRLTDVELNFPGWARGVARDYKGHDRSELDERLADLIEKRLNESGSVNLSPEHKSCIDDWTKYRIDRGQKAEHGSKLSGSSLSSHLEQLPLSHFFDEPPPPSAELETRWPFELPDIERISVNEELLQQQVEKLLNPSMSRVVKITQQVHECLGRFHRDVAAFGGQRPEEAPALAVVRELNDQAEIWFAGDVHADLLGFEAVMQTFNSEAQKDAKLIFLGDIVDRGVHDTEVVLSLWEQMMDSPGRYGWLAGNHDEGLRLSGDDRGFWSTVNPATFQDFLNDRLGTPEYRAFGDTFIKLVEGLPRALFLPGLLAAHGGFPHSDTWKKIKSFSELMETTCLSDFVWNRLAHSRKKRPNRSSSASTFGAEDFHGFRHICNERLDFPIEAMVRGHDHVSHQAERWERKGDVNRASYEGRILTVNTMSYNQLGDWMGMFTPVNPRAPTLARWRKGDILPTPVVVNLSAGLVNWYSPLCPRCNHPNRTGATQCENVAEKTIGRDICGESL
jgi:hypothetical protein